MATDAAAVAAVPAHDTVDPVACALALLAAHGGALLLGSDGTVCMARVPAHQDDRIALALALAGFDPVVRVPGWGRAYALRAEAPWLTAAQLAAFVRAGGAHPRETPLFGPPPGLLRRLGAG